MYGITLNGWLVQTGISTWCIVVAYSEVQCWAGTLSKYVVLTVGVMN